VDIRIITASNKEEFFAHEIKKLDEKNRSFDECLTEFEEVILRKTLQQYRGNISQTAKELKIPRPRLYRLMKKFALNLEEFH